MENGSPLLNSAKDILLIGSQASLKLGYPLRRGRPLDVDYIATFECAQRIAKEYQYCEYLSNNRMVMRFRDYTNPVEIEIAWPGSSAELLLRYVWSTVTSAAANEDHTRFIMVAAAGHQFAMVAPGEVLYMLKMSHRYLKNSPHFLKTRDDIMALRALGYLEIVPELRPIYELRMQETYHYQHPNLNRSKQDFFTPDVPYVYDHDDIHKVVARYGEPAYLQYLKDGAEVAWDKNKFLALAPHLQLAGVYEEAAVLALERSQIPFPNADRFESFKKALEKVCTSITSGYFREFAWEHYDVILRDWYNPSYVDDFWKAVDEGRVGKHQGSAKV